MFDKGIFARLDEEMAAENYAELDNDLADIFDMAMEAHTIDNATREKLPDKCFGVIEENSDGTKHRSYPLVVPGDDAATTELIGKAVQMFHYCKPERREALAKNIMAAIRKYNVPIEMSEASQIFKYVDKSRIPKCVTLVAKKEKKSK